MRRRIVILIVCAFVGGLAGTNPGMKAFSVFVADESERILRQKTGDSSLGRALAGAGAGLAGSYVERNAERRSYLLFSTYTLDLNGTSDDTESDWRFLGIGSQLIELDPPEETP